MKKATLFFMLVVLTAVLTVQTARATIWRVNNISNFNGTTLFGSNVGGTASYPVFPQINNAVGWSGVVNGDTLYVEGSNVNYGTATITKRLVIIGPGYFLTENPNTSNDVLPATIPSIAFSTGSAGSVLMGINIQPAGNTGHRLYLDVSELTVKRCRIERSVEIGSNVSDIRITDNFFSNHEVSDALITNGNTAYIYPNNIYFNNNICQKKLIWAGSILECNNNVFDLPANSNAINITTGSFKNNILKSVNATVNINNGTNLNVSYNVGTAASQFGTANSNIVVADMNTIFVDAGSNTTDGDYQLIASSAASNNGSDNTDRGAFGGAAITNRYTLSGLAPIPVIYNVSSPGVATPTGLPVTIKARTIK